MELMDKVKEVSEMEPTMGGFKGREHHYPLRVFYEDTDYVDNRIMPILALISL